MYQQKWTAKAETRSYHGEKLTETQFRNIFDGQLNAVAPLQSQSDSKNAKPTPFALQTYSSVESRLDQAVFRAMFATSPRQAAQFIRYGNVKVNGVTMKHANYKLSPGDIFSVDPDRVLQALGRSKPCLKESVDVTNSMIRRYNSYIRKCKKFPEYMWQARQRFRKRHPVYFRRHYENKAKRIAASNEKILKQMNKDINVLTPSALLKSILLQENYFDKFGTLPVIHGSEIHSKSLSVLQLVTGKRQNLTRAKEETATEEPAQNNTETAPASEASSSPESSSPSSSSPPPPTSSSSSSPSPEDASKTESESSSSSPSSSSSSSASTSDLNLPPVDEIRVEALVTKFFPPPKADGTQVSKSDLPVNRGDVKKLLLEISKIRATSIEKEAKSKLQDQRDLDKPEPYDPTWIERLSPELELIDYEAIKEEPNSVLPIRLPWQSGGHYGLQNPDKPYFSPWSPRPFLSPFVILPHHIEISFETCHAVYLRDPVARPGHSEVISPFPLDMHERAYMFYVTKRRK